jgi:hypothetical protein
MLKPTLLQSTLSLTSLKSDSGCGLYINIFVYKITTYTTITEQNYFCNLASLVRLWNKKANALYLVVVYASSRNNPEKGDGMYGDVKR